MQGRYEILSLSGSFLTTDLGGGNRQRTGGLSVSLAGSDGRVIGGGVAGMLTAASPIQVSDIYLLLESRFLMRMNYTCRLTVSASPTEMLIISW